MAELRCRGCGSVTTDLLTFACPQRHQLADFDHVMAFTSSVNPVDLAQHCEDSKHSFVRWRGLLPAYALARQHGLDNTAFTELVHDLDERIAKIEGHGFVPTPAFCAPRLAESLGLPTGVNVWVKDETGNVGGSHKARHLFGIMVSLEIAHRVGIPGFEARRTLAIASCGNAALAAAVVARAAGWVLKVFIPSDAEPHVVTHLERLEAIVHICPRDPTETGDPTYAAFLRAVKEGAVPFCCQGPDDGLTIPGGQTLAMELVEAMLLQGAAPTHVIVQVGGGALAAGIATGLKAAREHGLCSDWPTPRFLTVQTEGAWPLRRALRTARRLLPEQDGDIDRVIEYATHHRAEFMWPWEEPPHSVVIAIVQAHGILDDETYDWVAVTEAMLRSGGDALVVDDPLIIEARDKARDTLGINVCATGASGVAGLRRLALDGELKSGDTVVVILSGIERGE